MLVIETNISLNEDNSILDHQSIVVEVDSWRDYVNTYINEKSIRLKGTMAGKNFQEGSKILNLTHDDFHLSCDVDNGNFTFKKLAYRIRDEFSLQLNLPNK